ncbi:MAG: hypothetical protein ACRDA3_04425 [Peptostreptococcaceae bacterium]
MGKYKLDYFSKYYFYEEDDFLNEEEGQYILDQIKQSNRFDYKGYSYKFTKYGNVSKGETMRDVEIEIIDNSNNIYINGEISHLDLIYKFETRKLEDHIRIATRISEKTDDISCLLYIDYSQSDSFIKELDKVKQVQINNMNK